MSSRPTPEALHKLLRHDPETGLLFWRERTPDMFEDGKHTAQHTCRWWNARWSGKEAFTSTDGEGYKHGRIWYDLYSAARVIWAMETGAWPKNHIDHINHDRIDNRFSNLRDITKLENNRNRSIPTHNTSGVLGVYFAEDRQKWVAQINTGGKNIRLGRFDKMSDAVIAREAANIKYGFHPNHGRAA